MLKIPKTYSHHLAVLALSVLTVGVSVFLFTHSKSDLTLAAGPDDFVIVSGYAWNQKTGWISQRGVVGDAANKKGNYGVKIDKNNSAVTGWSWSSIYGWVCWGSTCTDPLVATYPDEPSSDPLCTALDVNGDPQKQCYGSSTPPSGYTVGGQNITTAIAKYACLDGTSPCDLSKNPAVVGWAKVIKLGSEGWIKLSSNDGLTLESGKYGITFNNASKQFDGWAWHCNKDITTGSCDTISSVGWVVFSGKTLGDPLLSDVTAACGVGETCATVSYDASSGTKVSKWYTEIISSWLETQGGNIYSKTGFTQPADGLRPPMLNDGYNASYLIHTNGAIEVTAGTDKWMSACKGASGGNSCGPSSDSQTPKTIAGFASPSASNAYRNGLGFINIPALTDTTEIGTTKKNKYGYKAKETSTLNLRNDLTLASEYNVFVSKGNLDIGDASNREVLNILNATEDKSGARTVVVEGDLHIYTPIRYDQNPPASVSGTASVAWIVTGKIIIDNCIPPYVFGLAGPALISGAFIAGDIIKTGSGASDKGDKGEGVDSTQQCVSTQPYVAASSLVNPKVFGVNDVPLQVNGIMMANSYSFQRVYTGNDTGAESIRDDGRLMANVPPGLEDMVKTLPMWRSSHISP